MRKAGVRTDGGASRVHRVAEAALFDESLDISYLLGDGGRWGALCGGGVSQSSSELAVVRCHDELEG